VNGTGRFGPERNGSTPHGSRLNRFTSRRKRATEPEPDGDTPPDAG
jgi:hypothetical protein